MPHAVNPLLTAELDPSMSCCLRVYVSMAMKLTDQNMDTLAIG